jgi:UDP-3-O-[3-hydroxymyristoyl] glucosamine N-acyltransferase
MIDTNFFSVHGPFALSEIASVIDAKLVNAHSSDINISGEIIIKSVNTIEEAQEGDIAVLNNLKYQHFLDTSNATVCIVDNNYDYINNPRLNYLICDDTRYASFLVTKMFYSEKKSTKQSSSIHSSAIIGEGTFLGHNVVIEENVEIGNNCYIDHNSIIKYGVKIGNNVTIGSNVLISCAIISDNTNILPGAVIGTEGFGFATYKGQHYKILHTGRVIIGRDVEIGANVVIARGSNLNDTVIGDGVMIDSLAQIAHNVKIGEGSVVVAQVGIAGSTKIGSYCVIGGQVGIAGHLDIEDFVQIAAQSGVMKNATKGQRLCGSPAINAVDFHRQHVTLKKLAKTNK